MADADRRAQAELIGQAAKALYDLDRLDLARDVARTALALNPAIGNLHSVMAGILDELGEGAAAMTHWREAARLMPGSPQQRFNLALAHLCRGEWAEGLPLYEVRVDKPDWVPAAARPSLRAQAARRLRPGDPVEGRRIMVFTEQGLGDCILFARYIPMLAARGAKVVLACNPDLRPVLAGVAGVAELLTPPATLPHGKVNLDALAHDAWVPLMSLPFFFGTTHATAPADLPYLTADAAAVAAWRARYAAALPGGRAKVGLVFRANPASASGADRSLEIVDLAPVLAVEGVDFVVLQAGPAGRALAAAHPRVFDALAVDVPLDGFAAAIAATDLLVTVDTMAVHLAGAIGHPACVVVPRHPHWYWGESGVSPWYPGIQVFRQGVRRSWNSPIAEVAELLHQRVGTV